MEFGVLAVLALGIGGFSLFVGYNKALAPLEVLRQHSAWTIHLPVMLGRMIGWAELLAASLLLAGLVNRPLARAGFWAALYITANHTAAAGFHVANSETNTYAQSVVMITLCAVMSWLYSRRA
jgi:hypothetical protein